VLVICDFIVLENLLFDWFKIYLDFVEPEIKMI